MSDSASTYDPWTSQLPREIQPRMSWTQDRLLMLALCPGVMLKGTTGLFIRVADT